MPRLPATLLLAGLVSSLVLAACAGDEADMPVPSAAPATTERSEAGDGQTTTRAREPLRLRVVRIAVGLESPVHVTTTPSEPDRLYVTEQAGAIRVVEGGKVRPRPFLDIRDQVESGGEQGLLSLAFHPDYETNGRLYVDYTDRNGDTRVVEYRANNERTAVDEATRRVILALDQPYANHNGGQLAFGPDGLLYVGMGDGGGGGDPDERAQDLSDLLGKLLRLDVETPGAKWEIVAYGLRNPWRFSFDRFTGDLYLGDVGQASREEIDYLAWPLGGLVNFGWDVYEGDLVHEDEKPNPRGRLVGPLAVYPLEGGRCSVVGGFAYRGSAMPALQGRYFFGDYCSGEIWSLDVRGRSGPARRKERFSVELLTSFGEDAAGEVLLVSHSGTIYRLVG